ncbi:hypothetical protein NIES3974_46470 [Calothrix sp. NIES-3974]|nr:hypothetical protein NIES3974_46470 [Calothrix sp. NIES-3974]
MNAAHQLISPVEFLTKKLLISWEWGVGSSGKINPQSSIDAFSAGSRRVIQNIKLSENLIVEY